MTTNRPIEQGGKLYNRLALNLAIMSPLPGDGSRIAVNASFTRMSVDENGDAELLPNDTSKSVLYSDIVTQGDEAALIALSKIEAALQEYVNTKGI